MGKGYFAILKLYSPTEPAINKALEAWRHRESEVNHQNHRKYQPMKTNTITQGSSIRVGVFQDRKEPAQWLGVPTDLLTPEAVRDDRNN